MRDMHELLQLAREDAPPARYGVDDIVAAGRRRRRLALVQKIGGVGTVAAAVVTAGVLIAGNVAFAPDGGEAADPAAPAAPPATGKTADDPAPFVLAGGPFTFAFGGYRMGAYHVLPPDSVNPGYQQTNIDRYGENYPKDKKDLEYVGTMTVYRPGVFKVDRFRTGTKVTIQGREAYQAQFTRVASNQINSDGEMVNGKEVAYTALAWQYGTDAWAVIEQDVISRGPKDFPVADQAALAEKFRLSTGEPVAARVPFRTGYLPAGYALLAVEGQNMFPGMVTFVYGKPDTSLESLTGPVSVERIRTRPTVVLSVLWRDTPPPDAKKRTSRCNEGQHWCKLDLPGGEFWVAGEDPSKTLTDRELLKVLDNLTFANIKKYSTWHPVD